MYIHRVILENIRGFVDLDLTFDHPSIEGHLYPGWNVLTGDNASGPKGDGGN